MRGAVTPVSGSPTPDAVTTPAAVARIQTCAVSVGANAARAPAWRAASRARSVQMSGPGVLAGGQPVRVTRGGAGHDDPHDLQGTGWNAPAG